MDTLQKPEIKKLALLIKCLLCSVLVFFAVGLSVKSVKDALRYRVASENPLTIQAQVTHVKTVVDTENGDSYVAMIKYSHGGIEYTDKYKSFNREEDARMLVDLAVTIQVDTKSPGDTLEEIKKGGKDEIFFGSVLLLFGLWLLSISHRRTYVQAYGWRREAAKKDMIRHIWVYESCYMIIIPIILYYSVVFYFAEVYFKISFGDIIAWLIALLSVVSLLKCIRRLKLVHQDRFYLCRDVFVSKQIVTDSEEGDTYYVTYRNSKGTWEKRVNKKIYSHACEGDTIDSAYLEAEKKPVLSYSHRMGIF